MNVNKIARYSMYYLMHMFIYLVWFIIHSFSMPLIMCRVLRGVWSLSQRAQGTRHKAGILWKLILNHTRCKTPVRLRCMSLSLLQKNWRTVPKDKSYSEVRFDLHTQPWRYEATVLIPEPPCLLWVIMKKSIAQHIKKMFVMLIISQCRLQSVIFQDYWDHRIGTTQPCGYKN